MEEEQLSRYDQTKKAITAMSREELEAEVLNDRYNDFCREYCDDQLQRYVKSNREKGIPYLGWFWRSVDFFNLRIPIGKAGFIGFMENNKWDAPERDLTEDEALTVIGFLDKAMEADDQGGQLSEIYKNVAIHLDELYDYLQTLDVPYIDY